MLIIFCVSLVFTIGRCTDGLSFVTKTVGVGQDVTLTCSRNSTAGGILFWFRLVAGNLPEVLGTTYFYGHATSNETPRITAKLGPGTFVLRITQTKRSDTALYYCEKIAERRKSSSNVTFLTVKANISAFGERVNIVLFLMCAALVISLIVIALLIYTIKTKKCDCFNAAAAPQINAPVTSGVQQRQTTEEDSLVYSVPNFTRKKNGRRVREGAEVVEGESIYADVRVLGYE
ncbi:uncharacterized protein LOC103375010 [Stegastes partitus]|uniref:Uncharacterized protein LOC103375010 n=1 Tax=Stegastes partitus TaxID=144197 RepID=A0A9Y4NTU0_9TELE|nr:PREDICTED: uncharacterized protein LOC103375010 [Stegastes partitus]